MSLTVLVAEDELLIAMDVMDELDEAGYVVVGPFSSASRALEYCETHTPDCAVLDVRLSDGDSFALADLLVERNAALIFHSGHAARGALTQRYPQARVCPKPAACREIARHVTELCASSAG